MTIYELALNALGEKGFKAGSPNEKPLEIEFKSVLREAISRYAWNFAKKLHRASSAQDGRYALPLDCMRVLEVRHAESLDKVRGYQLIGDTLSLIGDTSSGELDIIYISDEAAVIGEIPDRYPAFCRAVVYLLASRASMAITGNLNIQQIMEEQANRHFTIAITKDRQQDASNDQHPFDRIIASDIY